LIEPQGYIEFQGLLKYAEKVITDSGGLQKEAYMAKKPCITLRSETEWVETVAAGWNLLCDFNDADLVNKVKMFQPPVEHPVLYGERVAERMVEEIPRFAQDDRGV
jgi:UDP-N-acetylglucosamine 2-epimerase